MVKKVQIPFYRLNLIYTYNHNMNNVDITDQLRTIYRLFMWLRERKWWWTMFFWCFEMLLINTYIFYCKFQLLHNRKPMRHYEFHRQVTLAWLKSDVYWTNNSRDSRLGVSSNISTDEDSSGDSRAWRSLYAHVIPEAKYGARVTDQTLHPSTGKLKERLNKNKRQLPVGSTKKYSRCQIHYWTTKKIVFLTCDVTICINYYSQFHLVPDIFGSKRALTMIYCAELNNREV